MQRKLCQSLTNHQGVNTLGNNGFDIRPLKINNSEMNYLNKKRNNYSINYLNEKKEKDKKKNSKKNYFNAKRNN